MQWTRPRGHGNEPSSSQPLYARALDAFEAFYLQLGVVSQRMAELRVAFDTTSIPFVVLAVADLSSALGVLYARLELLEVVTNDDAGRDLWAHPMMGLMRSQLRALLQDGEAYASRHPEDWRVLQQLREVALTLDNEEQLASEIAGNARSSDEHTGDTMDDHASPGPRIAIIADQSSVGLATRCRMRRPWRRQAWRRPRRGEPP